MLGGKSMVSCSLSYTAKEKYKKNVNGHDHLIIKKKSTETYFVNRGKHEVVRAKTDALSNEQCFPYGERPRQEFEACSQHSSHNDSSTGS